jgi:hypothetical protein
LSIVATLDKIVSLAKAAAHPIDSFVNAVKYEGDKGLKYEKIDDGYEGKGMAITAGIASGIRKGAGEPVGAITALSDAMKAAFSGPKGIDAHSPSREFERRAVHIPEGTAAGVERGAPVARQAVTDMLGDAAPRASSGASWSIGSVTVMLPATTPRSFLSELADHLRTAADSGFAPVPS